jgi:hypothetical protein
MDTLTHKDLRSDHDLKEQGFNDDEIRMFRHEESVYYDLAVELDDAEAKKDYTRIVELEEQLELKGLDLLHRGKNPKEVPLDDLKKLIHNSVPDSLEDSTSLMYRRRVKNPATAIRALCVLCMSGQPAEVRKCEAMSCVFWPFRLGSNPFAGKALPPVEELHVEDDDHVEVDESEEGEDASE